MEIRETEIFNAYISICMQVHFHFFLSKYVVICKSYGTLNGVNTDLVTSIIYTCMLHTTLFKMICFCITVINSVDAT